MVASTSGVGGEVDVEHLSKTLAFELTESIIDRPLAMVAWLCAQRHMLHLR